MSRSKKIFAAIAIVFFGLLAYVVYDISSRTTFPGSGRKANPSHATHDSIASDSIKEKGTPR